MASQVSFRLPDPLLEELDRRASTLRRRRSELIRIAVERFLAETEERHPELRPVDRVRHLLGSYESGVPDLGQHHREHLSRRLRGGG